MTRLVLVFLLLSAATTTAAAAFNAFEAAGIDRLAAARAPLDRQFRDERGAIVTLGDLAQGKPIVLAPVLHDCPNICGVTLSGLAQAIQAQDLHAGRDFIVVAFGIDPNEAADDARADLDRLRRAVPGSTASGWHGLTGAAPDIEAVTAALGYRYAWDDSIGQYAHVAAVAVLAGDGTLSRWLYGVTFEPTDLKLAVLEAGKGQVGSWTDQILLLCYHYDPTTGRYGSIVWTVLRIAGGLTAIAIAGAIGWTVLREHRSRRSPPP